MIKGPYIKEFCEFLGVTVLCFLTIGLPLFTNGKISPAEGSIFAGCVVMLLIYGIGTISGAHVNPTVSLAFLVSQRFSQAQFLRYITAQFLGSIFALILLIAAVGRNVDWAAAAPKMLSPVAFAIEACLSGFLIFTIFNVATADCRICPDARPLAGVIIGSAVAALSFFGSGLGVGVLNPAVMLVFALVANCWLAFALYLAATSLGALAAVLLYQLTHPKAVEHGS
jgi:glycerol uptake facilitator-like aquaporin